MTRSPTRGYEEMSKGKAMSGNALAAASELGRPNTGPLLKKLLWGQPAPRQAYIRSAQGRVRAILSLLGS